MSHSTLIVLASALSAATVFLTIALVKLLRDERRRSQARVAMLAAMADEGVADLALAEREPEDLELRYQPDVAAPVALFSSPQARSAWPQRILVAAALASIVGAVGFAVRAVAPSGSTPGVTGAPASEGPPLDLLSLKHAQEPGALVISGLVQNPREGVRMSGVNATAFLFAADGSFLASGRAAIDFTTLQPGAESAFSISVPVSAPVSRYRIGFRGDDGRIIGHTDRRTAGSIARGPS